MRSCKGIPGGQNSILTLVKCVFIACAQCMEWVRVSSWTVAGLSSVLSSISEVCHVVLTVWQHDWLLVSAVLLSFGSPTSLKSPVLLLYRESERVVIEKTCLTVSLVKLWGKSSMCSVGISTESSLGRAGPAGRVLWGLGLTQYWRTPEPGVGK